MSLSEQVKRIAELDAKRPKIDLSTAEIHEDGLTYECPLCDGDSFVEGHQFINVSDKALNVFFSGIGDEFVNARGFFDAAPSMAKLIAQLWEEREQLRTELDEQCRVNGIGGERELALMAKNERLREGLAKAREALDVGRQNLLAELCSSSEGCSITEAKGEVLFLDETIAHIDGLLKEGD